MTRKPASPDTPATDTGIFIPAWIDGQLQPVDKIEAHERGLRHKAVSVFVMHGGALLLQRRALGKYHTPGLWANTCCTHPHWGEATVDCAVRRLREELGIAIGRTTELLQMTGVNLADFAHRQGMPESGPEGDDHG